MKTFSLLHSLNIHQMHVFRCVKTTKRKELRDLTLREVAQFQQSISYLRFNTEYRVWQQFRDLYKFHIMHANRLPYFLLWHRYFIRQLELKLKEIDCNIVLPYFDFTTDAGNFSHAILWQSNYFGGNGVQKNNGCIHDHPFGDPRNWKPCISRHFNTNLSLPTQIEVAIALSSEDFIELSKYLKTFIYYIHAYVGGNMLTDNGPYDPIFYVMYSYIDMLYWQWQQKADNKFKYHAAYLHIPVSPFNIFPQHMMDSEKTMCVSYVLPSRGHPCNVTRDQRYLSTSITVATTSTLTPAIPVQQKNRGDISVYEPSVHNFLRNGSALINLLSYDSEGFDRSGFDRYGYDRKGKAFFTSVF